MLRASKIYVSENAIAPYNHIAQFRKENSYLILEEKPTNSPLFFMIFRHSERETEEKIAN